VARLAAGAAVRAVVEDKGRDAGGGEAVGVHVQPKVLLPAQAVRHERHRVGPGAARHVDPRLARRVGAGEGLGAAGVGRLLWRRGTARRQGVFQGASGGAAGGEARAGASAREEVPLPRRRRRLDAWSRRDAAHRLQVRRLRRGVAHDGPLQLGVERQDEQDGQEQREHRAQR
jgi:hypothetical protein